MNTAKRAGRALRVWVGTGLVIGMALIACTDKAPVRIGFVGGTSGRVADLGVSGRDAAQLVVEQCNADGGINGRPVQLLIEDDRQDPETARSAVAKLIEQGVAAIVGPMTSDMAVAVAPLVNQAGVLMVSPTATTQALSRIDDQFFRITSTTEDFAAKSARHHLASGKIRRFAAVYDLGNRTFCENWLAVFREVFAAGGGQIVTAIGFSTNAERTFLDMARDLLAPRPDGVLIIANSMDSAMLCQQVRKIDSDIPISLADWGATERLLEMGGAAVEGVTVVQTFDRDSPSPRYQAFRRTYLQRYGREPGFPGVHAHDATQVVLTALRLRQKDRSLKQVLLANRQFQGLQSDFSFNDFGDVQRSLASISIVRNRQFVVVE